MHAHYSGQRNNSTLPCRSAAICNVCWRANPNYCLILSETLYRPFLREEMLAFLDANTSNTCDESGLHYVLRSLRKRVISRLAIRDLERTG